jgi:hypothetical protein
LLAFEAYDPRFSSSSLEIAYSQSPSLSSIRPESRQYCVHIKMQCQQKPSVLMFHRNIAQVCPEAPRLPGLQHKPAGIYPASLM